MNYLLDTNIYIYLRTGSRKVLDKIIEIGDEHIFLSAISMAELYFGAYRSEKKGHNLETLKKNLEAAQIINFNRHAAKIFGRLKADAFRRGHPIADMDLAIASIAINRDLTLVTHNTRHFEPIRELRIEDWC